MDQDLQDLLAVWLGDHDPGETRREALLERLRRDHDFRRTFVEELRLLGMLRAVQSSEPRWLRLEDEMGWSVGQRADVEALVRQVLQEGDRLIRLRRWLRWATALAAIVVLVVGLYVAWKQAGSSNEVVSQAQPAIELATAIKVQDVCWEPDSPAPTAGSVVTSGRLRLRSGRLTLAFFSGVALTIEGPADLELFAANRVFCHQGKLRARVPPGAEGFTVFAPGFELVDLGTEFGLNLEPGGMSRVMVFEGEASVSVVGQDGRSVRGVLLDKRRSVEVDPAAGRIQEVPLQPDAFIPLAEFMPDPLELVPGYAAAVMAAKPWGYWRFEELVDGRVANEIAGRPALVALGGVDVERSPNGNGWARFLPDRQAQAFLMEDDWVPSRGDGYAMELWVQADLPSPKAFGQTALVSLIVDDSGKENHLAYLELTARGRRSPHEPCAVRFLDRWPPDVWGGANVFSRRTMVPSLWRHIVGQKARERVELYVDGECVGMSPAKLDASDPEKSVTAACRLLVGRLKQKSLPPHAGEIRAFEGRLAELAVYDRSLTIEEIQQHSRMRLPVAAP
jgi:hypothetical protein